MAASFDMQSLKRIAQVVRRVERMPLSSVNGDGASFPAMLAPIFVEVEIGERQNDDSGSGSGSPLVSPAVQFILDPPTDIEEDPPQTDITSGEAGGSGSGSGSGECGIPIYAGTALKWNGCGWTADGNVWLFHLDGGTLSLGGRCLARVIDSHYKYGDSSNKIRPLCEIFSGSGARRQIEVLTGACLLFDEGEE